MPQVSAGIAQGQHAFGAFEFDRGILAVDDPPALLGNPDLFPGIVGQVDIDRLAVSGIPQVHVLLGPSKSPMPSKWRWAVRTGASPWAYRQRSDRRATESTVLKSLLRTGQVCIAGLRSGWLRRSRSQGCGKNRPALRARTIIMSTCLLDPCTAHALPLPGQLLGGIFCRSSLISGSAWPNSSRARPQQFIGQPPCWTLGVRFGLLWFEFLFELLPEIDNLTHKKSSYQFELMFRTVDPRPSGSRTAARSQNRTHSN